MLLSSNALGGNEKNSVKEWGFVIGTYKVCRFKRLLHSEGRTPDREFP